MGAAVSETVVRVRQMRETRNNVFIPRILPIQTNQPRRFRSTDASRPLFRLRLDLCEYNGRFCTDFQDNLGSDRRLQSSYVEFSRRVILISRNRPPPPLSSCGVEPRLTDRLQQRAYLVLLLFTAPLP